MFKQGFDVASGGGSSLTPELMHDFQQRAVNFQCTRPESMLWLDMGLGKTVVTLTTAAHLIHSGFLRAVVVVAPIRVCRLVWRQEAMKWSHLKHLTFSAVLGDQDQRTRALLRPAQVYLINYENLGWLATTLHQYFVGYNKPLPFDGIVWDEVSKMKNSSTERVKNYRKVAQYMKWATGLTGTPASNGYKDLHGQYLVVDQGKRLGTSKTQFKTRFYKKAGSYKEIPYDDTEDTIKGLISDMTLEMSAEEYHKLPDMIVNNVEVELPGPVRVYYEQLEKDFFTQLENGTEIEVFNSAALTNKCLQVANGAVYPIGGMPMWEPVHDAKLDALEEILDEAQGQPILCSYAYRSDAERIMTRFKDLDPINLTECHSEKALNGAMTRWVGGTCKLMIGHPASMGHGIDGLQKAGHIIVWFGLNWSLDLYEQMIARIRRQGQGAPVICHRIMARATLDQAQALALDGKAVTQASLRAAVRQYRLEKGE